MSVRIAAFSAVDLSLPQGHALHLRGLLDALAARGHDVTLVTPRPAGTTPAVRFRAVKVPSIRWSVLGPWSFEILGGFRLLAHCLAARADLIYARQDLYTCAPAIVAALLHRPLVVEVNASIPDELDAAAPRLARSLARRSERFMLTRSRSIVTLGAGLAAILAARTGVAVDRFRVVPIATHLPAPIDPAQERARRGTPPERFVIAFAGNLRPVQGIETLIDAVARAGLPDTELWIIGTGMIEPSLRARAGAGDVRFQGGVAREEADRLLACAQILVAPYLRGIYDRVAGDAISSKVLAYLASDRPVVISDIPYYRWVAEIGAGECFASGDAVDLAARITSWRARWIDAGRPLQGWPWSAPGPGRRFVEDGRTWEAAAARVEEVLREAATSSAPPARS